MTRRKTRTPRSPRGVAAAGAAVEYDDDIDLRAEDDALIAAELEAAEAEAELARAKAEEEGEEPSEDTDDSAGTRTRRRSRRGGRGRSRSAGRNTGPLEGTFDHGEEGYGLWLDPAVQDNPVYAEHWAGHRPVEVEVEEDRIVIRRTGASDD